LNLFLFASFTHSTVFGTAKSAAFSFTPLVGQRRSRQKA
jgi:hypothetical protein